MIRIGSAVYTHPFVNDEDLKWSLQGYSFCLLANQLSHWGVNVCAHLLHNNFIRNFSLIQSGP